MRSNAIARIVLYSLLILLLLGILVTFLCFDLLSLNTDSGKVVAGEGVSLDAAEVSWLELDWAAGSITILTADTDQITFSESGEIAGKYSMVYRLEDGVLSIDYAKGSVTFGFGNIPRKDLTITVPRDWVCKGLELDGAALEVAIDGLTVIDFEIDGAANEISFTGAFQELSCDGAACELTVNCLEKPGSIYLDGASIELNLYLPDECGFLVQMSGPGCSFRSDLAYTGGNGDYLYGDRRCKIYADGLSCAVTVNQAPAVMEIK